MDDERRPEEEPRTGTGPTPEEEGLRPPSTSDGQPSDVQPTIPLPVAPASDALLTTPLPPSPAGPEASLELPLRWGPYELLGILGEGGMGRVYRARDLRLDRLVALKFIRSPDPAHVERFLREARLQAKIEHDNVCRVYEVGMLEDRHFIAMALIDGPSLLEAGSQMTLDEKLAVAADVARALDAGHRQGLIHRDVKPSNVMLERSDRGAWKPYVMDFGLARSEASSALTASGVALGTPSYMSPEQAAGSRELDLRSDVYSLGATLYEMLVGEPPFGRGSSFEIIVHILQDDPPSPRSVDPSLPPEVETLVLTCLARDPDLRYATARDLAEDLDRLRRGDPIEAQPVTIAYRLVARARKNRLAVGIALAALLTVLALLGLGWREQHRAALARELERRFDEEVEVIDEMLRHAYTSPLHDVREEQAQVRERLAAIERQVELEGEIAAGPGHYALGRGRLALREPEAARRHLELAWERDDRRPAVAYALGQALGALYERDLRGIERSADAAARDARRQVIDETYREPAVRFLELAEGVEAESRALLEARLAYLGGRYEEALVLARDAHRDKAWVYEAPLLEGVVQHDLGDQARLDGRYGTAGDRYQQAREAFAAAAAIARSDPELFTRLCQVELSALLLVSQSSVQMAEPLRERGLEACHRALTADPEALVPGQLLAELHWRLAEVALREGYDPTSQLEAAQLATKALLANHPEDAVAHNQTAVASRLHGRWLMRVGEDPRPSLEAAIVASRRSQELDPDYAYAFNTMGGAYKALAEHEGASGLDPTASLVEAATAYERAQAVDSRLLSPFLNSAGVYLVLADWELAHGRDPASSLARARSQLEALFAINPRYPLGLVYQAQAARLEATDARRRGSLETSARALDRALASLDLAGGINPELSRVWSDRAAVLLDRVELTLGQPGDPSSDLEAAAAALDRAMEVGDRRPELALVAARQLWLRGRSRRVGEEDPRADFEAAASRLASVEGETPHDPALWLARAELAWWRAAGLAPGSASRRRALAEGVAAADRGLELSPDQALLLAWRGALRVELGPEQVSVLGRADLQRARQLAPGVDRLVGLPQGAAAPPSPE